MLEGSDVGEGRRSARGRFGEVAPELAGVQVRGLTRGAFILRGALAAGAVYGLGAVGPFVGQALGQAAGTDGTILNFALTLEYLEAEFYKRARRLRLTADVRRLTQTLYDDESAHVEALQNALNKLGETPIVSPKFQFPMHDETSFLRIARFLEDTGVGAYNGAAPMVQSTEVLAFAGGIVQIEGRHASLIRMARGQAPSPNGFDEGLGKEQVLTRAMPYVTTAPLPASPTG